MFTFFANFFANPVLLGGAAAGSIPIVIHLLNRQRFKKVVWAAMHWLWASYKKSKRRVQIEQLILLLIRILLLVLLATALARPALQQGIGLLTGQASTHRIIVLDNSFSMGQLVGGHPLFEKAKQSAVDLVEKMSASDEVDVLLANGTVDELTSTSLMPKKDVLDRIRTAALSDGGTDIPKSIAAACRVLTKRNSQNARREIVLITDQTRAGWEQPGHQPKRISGDDESAVASAFSNPQRRPKILIMRLPGEKECDNLAAVKLEVDEKVVPARADTQFIGTVACFAASAQKNVRVKLKVDGEEVASETIASIAPDKPESVIFHYVFPEAGSHSVAMELDNDILPADNTAFLAVDVEDQMRVLCVDGQQRVGPNASVMDFFRQALSPSKSEEINAGKMPLFPEVISDSALGEANLDNYRLVVLGNVGVIPAEKVQSLVQFVKRGGALWIFVGDKVDPAIYNKELAELLPMTLGEKVGSDDPDGPKESLSDKDIDHPAIRKFKGIRGLPLSHLQVFQRMKLLPKPEPDPSVRTVLSYENGEPAAAEKTIGENGGRVMLFGTTVDKSWNNWPGKNHYMPLMNFIALYLIQPSYLERNKFYGERFVLQIPRQDLGEVRRTGIRLVDPSGEAASMEILTELSRAESTTIKKAGIYTAEIPGEKKHIVHFAANRNTDESDLSVIDDREILSFIAREGETKPDQTGYFKTLITQSDLELMGDDLKAVEESLKKSAGSREIWRWLAGMVLALLLVESFLARRFGDFTR